MNAQERKRLTVTAKLIKESARAEFRDWLPPGPVVVALPTDSFADVDARVTECGSDRVLVVMPYHGKYVKINAGPSFEGVAEHLEMDPSVHFGLFVDLLIENPGTAFRPEISALVSV